MPLRLAALPMYPGPETPRRDFWDGLRRHLAAAGLAGLPDALTGTDDLDALWRDPDLLLAQTCGYPLTHALEGKVQLVGTPHYTAPGCEGAFYLSFVVVRGDDPARDLGGLAGRRAAFNGRDSQSGYNALRRLVAPLAHQGRFFGAVMETGSHRASMRQVAKGEADVAAIDCVSFALARRDRPAETAALRVLARTARAPGLPFVTAAATPAADLARLRSGLAAAFADPALAPARNALLLAGFEVLPLSAYEICLTMEKEAVALGYPDLA